METLGKLLGASGRVLSGSWVVLGSSWASLEGLLGSLGGSWEGFGSLLDASWQHLGEFLEVLDDLLETFYQLRQDLERQQGKNMKIELPCRRELDSEGPKGTKNRPQIDENVVQKAMLGKQKGKIASSLLKIDEKLLLKGFLEALSAFYRSPWLLSGPLLGRPWPPQRSR